MGTSLRGWPPSLEPQACELMGQDFFFPLKDEKSHQHRQPGGGCRDHLASLQGLCAFHRKWTRPLPQCYGGELASLVLLASTLTPTGVLKVQGAEFHPFFNTTKASSHCTPAPPVSLPGRSDAPIHRFLFTCPLFRRNIFEAPHTRWGEVVTPLMSPPPHWVMHWTNRFLLVIF